MNAPKVNKRILALDILRGFTIAGMILVNNPGSWGHIYAPLRHAEWNGLTPTDLVFPFFLFAMGAALPFSIGSRLERGDRWWRVAFDVVLRWLQLAFFAIFIQHFYPYVLSSPQDLRSWALAMGAFALLFPMFMRFERVPQWGRVLIKVAAYAVAVVMLLTTS